MEGVLVVIGYAASLQDSEGRGRDLEIEKGSFGGID